MQREINELRRELLRLELSLLALRRQLELIDASIGRNNNNRRAGRNPRRRHHPRYYPGRGGPHPYPRHR